MKTHCAALVLAAALWGCGAPGPDPAPANPNPERCHSRSSAEVPDTPASGSIKGRAFSVEKAEIKEGILELRMGKDFFPDGQFQVFLFMRKGELPAGRKWRVKPNDGFDSPHVHMQRKESSDKLPKTESFMNKYTMLLEFGAEQDKVVAGKIELCLPDAEKSWVAGTFKARVSGFRLVNGKPDLTEDSFGNFEWLAAEALKGRNGGKPVEILSTFGGKYASSPTPGQAQTGRAGFRWRGADKRVQSTEFEFEKRTAWKIAREGKSSEVEKEKEGSVVRS